LRIATVTKIFRGFYYTLFFINNSEQQSEAIINQIIYDVKHYLNALLLSPNNVELQVGGK
ncbi:hypothetical protein, partial [Vibrio sp. V27_P1S3P104]